MRINAKVAKAIQQLKKKNNNKQTTAQIFKETNEKICDAEQVCEWAGERVRDEECK